jgi:hypothetical protein
MLIRFPAVQVFDRFAFRWRADSPVCELYAADLEALSSVCLADVIAAGLPARTVGSLCSEAILIRAEADGSRRWGCVDFPFMLALDGRSGDRKSVV